MSYNSHGDLLNGKPAMTKEYRSKAKTLVPDLVIEYSKHHRRDFVICSSLCLSLCLCDFYLPPPPPPPRSARNGFNCGQLFFGRLFSSYRLVSSCFCWRPHLNEYLMASIV